MTESQFAYLKVASMDMALNEHEKIGIDRAPILYLYLAGDRRHPKEYRQDLEIDQLKSWLQYWVSELNIYKHDL